MPDQALPDLIRRLTRQVCTALRVDARGIAVQVHAGTHVSHADVTWPPAPARIVISRDRITPAILAHEITHCLVPTRWLFFAEGFATWMGCETAGNCEDLCFAEADVEAVLRRHGPSAALAGLVTETLGQADAFAPDSFHRAGARLAYASAASFLRWFCRRHPGLPAQVAQPSCVDPVAQLVRLSGRALADLERGWRCSLDAGGTS
jgi:hypothetical protein